LPGILYGCEIWFAIKREEHRVTVFENKRMGKTFGSKREEAI